MKIAKVRGTVVSTQRIIDSLPQKYSTALYVAKAVNISRRCLTLILFSKISALRSNHGSCCWNG